MPSDLLTASTARDRDLVKRYTRLAFVYDAWTWLTESRSLAVGLSRAAIRDGEAVLEVAVGTGFLFRDILAANPSGRTVGVDLNEGMLGRARRKAQSTAVSFELLHADARSLPFGDGSFDVVFNSNMLGLLAPTEVAPILSEMRRVLRPEGRLILVTMMRPKHPGASLIYRLGAVGLGLWRDVQLEPIARAVGFEVVGHQVVEQLGVPSEILDVRKR